MPNGEHHDHISFRRRCTEKLPAFLAARVCSGDNCMRPLDSFLDFLRVDSVAIDMANIVRIAIEASQAFEHNPQYIQIMYIQQAARPGAVGAGRRSGPIAKETPVCCKMVISGVERCPLQSGSL